ncbi:MAG TPA: DUF1569 domain-containing protein [Tepidisphaeraceae bacterium]|jgi:hypothetical protein
MGKLKRRRLVFEDFAQVRTEIARLETAGYTRTGNWSLGQICDHLAKSFKGMVDGFDFEAPWPMRMAARIAMPLIFWIKWVPSGAKIPKSYEPATDVSDETGVIRFTQAFDRLEKHSQPLAKHPFMGSITPEQWRKVQLIHCAHHLGFLVPK